MRDRRREKRQEQQRRRDRQTKEGDQLPQGSTSTVPAGNYKRVNLHDMTAQEAEVIIDWELTEAERCYDGILFIHGYRHGNKLKNLIPPIAKKWGKKVFHGTTNQGETIVLLD